MKRVLTAAIAIPVVVLITLFSPDWLFAVVVSVVSALGVEEFLALADKKGIGRPGRWFLVCPGLVVLSFLGGASLTLAALMFAVLTLMTAAIYTDPLDAGLGKVGMGLGSLVYCSLTLGFLVLMPRELIIVLLCVIWAGDTAAYYCGSAFGRHLLAPKVSPKKTVEGAIAGLIASMAAGVLVGTWLLGEPWLPLLGVSAAAAIAGQVGDLAESVLKRSAGVKDSSSILPGHGGILDRLDSLFFAVPVFYWFFNT